MLALGEMELSKLRCPERDTDSSLPHTFENVCPTGVPYSPRPKGPNVQKPGFCRLLAILAAIIRSEVLLSPRSGGAGWLLGDRMGQ